MDKQTVVPGARRTRVEPGIYQRPDGKLEIGFRDAQGRQRWRKVTGGVTAARRARNQEVAKRDRGERIAADPRMRFDTAAEAWWQAHAVRQRPNTRDAYRAALKHVNQVFGRRRLADIDLADVARYVSDQEGEFKGWTVRKRVGVLSAVFTFAAGHLGYAGQNPAAMLSRAERPTATDESPKRILNQDELDRLLAAVPGEQRLIYTLAAETAARLSEALGVAWCDIDTEAMTVTFTHQLDRHGHRVPLKTTASHRPLEVTQGLAKALREHRVASSRSGDHDLVFVNRAGRGHDQRNIGGRVLARAVKQAGLEAVERDGVVVVPAPTFHDLRHSHASALIAAGWDIAEVSARLRHGDVSTTMRTYVHEFDQAARSGERRDRLQALYGSARGSSTPQDGTDDATAARGEVVDLRAVRDGRQ